MAFRSPTQSSIGPTSYYSPTVNQNPMNPIQQQSTDDAYASATSPTLRTKRPRPLDMQPEDANSTPVPPPAATTGDSFIQDQEANDDGDDDDDDDDGKKTEKKAGRRKIKIEFIQDKSRRHITFSKRKAGIMKKAYELSTLTGTQVLLLVVSETGLVYTFTTAKLQPLVTQPEGKNLIQACLNAPHGQLPNVGPGQPMSRMNSSPQSNRSNVPGGLSIGGTKEDDGEGEEEDDTAGSATTPTSAKPRTRRRTSSNAVAGGHPPPGPSKQSGTSPTSPNQQAPSTPTMPMHQQGPPQPTMAMSSAQSGHGQQPQAYSQQNHGAVPNVGYSNPTDAAGGPYMQQGHPHPGHPQMMAQYHMGQQHSQQGHPQAAHWGQAAPQAVPQGAPYRR